MCVLYVSFESKVIIIIIIFIYSPISNIHRGTSSVDYITITYINNISR